MSDAAALQRDGVEFAQRAVDCDKRSLYDTAAFYYLEAADALLAASMAGCQTPGLIDRANQYVQRAEAIKAGRTGGTCTHSFAGGTTCKAPVKTEQQLDLDRAEYSLREAFDEDENGNEAEATELYMEAAEMFLKIRKESAGDKALQTKVAQLAGKAIERAEVLKGKGSRGPAESRASQESGRAMPPLGFGAFSDAPVASGATGAGQNAARAKQASPKAGGYTKEEIQVLRFTSFVNQREYVPFMSVDVKERFGFPIPFGDKCGKLALSPKQQSRFGRWVRPDEFLDNPTMILAISSFSIKQDKILGHNGIMMLSSKD